MDAAALEVTWAIELLQDLCVTNLKPITLFCDNQFREIRFYERIKHIEVDYDKVLEDLIQ